ncbi:MAG: prephenate dehydrogenase [Candidatus Omnitrophica bacterium]|nr:prephenate dehydrogenase [Candidatus Omnitrophota bacterium]
MRLFRKVAIVGVGLIGGSIGLEIKKRSLAGEVIGMARHRRTLSIARKRGAIDRGVSGLEEIKDADLVILAAPVGTIINMAPRLSKVLKRGCIVSDVGSTKASIVEKMERLLPRGIDFVGAHPLAGMEKRGISNARLGLFKGSICVLCRAKNTRQGSVLKIGRLWRLLGSRVWVTSPKNHDRTLAFASHLPHIAAFSLVNAVPAACLRFSSGGFKDTTRIALSDEEIWKDIFISNKKYVTESIESYQEKIAQFKSALRSSDRSRLSRLIKQARSKRSLI